MIGTEVIPGADIREGEVSPWIFQVFNVRPKGDGVSRLGDGNRFRGCCSGQGYDEEACNCCQPIHRNEPSQGDWLMLDKTSQW